MPQFSITQSAAFSCSDRIFSSTMSYIQVHVVRCRVDWGRQGRFGSTSDKSTRTQPESLVQILLSGHCIRRTLIQSNGTDVPVNRLSLANYEPGDYTPFTFRLTCPINPNAEDNGIHYGISRSLRTTSRPPAMAPYIHYIYIYIYGYVTFKLE